MNIKYYYKDGIHKSNELKTKILTLEEVENGEAKKLFKIISRCRSTESVDCNNIEVFEGDIIYTENDWCSDHSKTTFVAFSGSGFECMIKEDDDNEVTDNIFNMDCRYTNMFECSDISIVGNIHQNKDLL